MDASLDVCPTEEAIKAFLEYLVDPVLPPKSSLRDTPSLSQQESVAKQVHAVVLLYNYYHRKQCPKLDALNFDSFCKLVLVMKPALLFHMKFMQMSGNTELDDPEKQLSVTEKAIMDACNIYMSLDPSKEVPNTEAWPISKVSVLLIDSKKENCFLLFSSITQGVWSMIEKDFSGESKSDEARFAKLAYSAVSDATGIKQTKLVVLESHVVFSVSKEKAAAGFFIIQCTETVSEDIIHVPIKEVIDSLQGPLVRKSSSTWTYTPVVEYFHVLPYAGILSDWFSRRECSIGFLDSRLGEVNIIVSSPERIEPCKLELDKSQERSDVNDFMIENIENNTTKPKRQYRKQKATTGIFNTSLAGYLNGPQRVEVDDSSVVPSQNEQICKNISSTIQVVNHNVENIEFTTTKSKPQSRKQKAATEFFKKSLAGAFNGPQKIKADESSMVSQSGELCKNISRTIQVVNHQEKLTSCIKSDLNGSASNAKVNGVNWTTRSFITENGVNNVVAGKVCAISSSDQDGIGGDALITYQSSSQDLQKLQIAIASKGNILSQTALKVLMKKRDELSLQQRNIEDEIAQCDKKIQTILNGDEDDLALKVESIIEGCNDVCVRTERTHRLLDDKFHPQNIKRKRLSEAILNVQSPCQELDGACYENNWILPTYSVSSSDGGFQAYVTLKGMDFECSSGGDLCTNPGEARESAAAQILEKLRSLAGEARKL